MRKLLVVAVALSLVFASGAAARTSAPKPPRFPPLPGNWTHVEINLKIKSVPHTLILDRGRVTQYSPLQLTLREADGSVWQVPLSSSTIVTFRGATRFFPVLRRGLLVETMRIDDGAAVRVLVLRRR